MSAAVITAIGIAVPAVIASVVSLVMVFRHTSDSKAHINRETGNPQSLRLRHGGMS